ncbi:MAG: hypothetical protein ACM37W_23385, partial [Actinomycetota bacterium]
RIHATDTVSIDGVSSNGKSGGVGSVVGEGAIGNGGGIDITARSLSVTNGGVLSATSSGNGAAGNVTVKANSILLENQAAIKADTPQGQGNIFLRSRDLVLDRNSNITTNATGTANGGNIGIQTQNLIGLNNSDIKANAQQGFGGNVSIEAQTVLGIRPRDRETPESDITASSELGLQFSGSVQFNTQVNTTFSLVPLPQTVFDPNALIAQNPCQRGRESSFTITGRDGLPPGPSQLLNRDTVRVDLVEPALSSNHSTLPQTPPHPEASSLTIVPAMGWIRNEKGEVILVGSRSTNLGVNRLKINPPTCQPPTQP